jgi:rfaE bifunctional protein nucleotidyltransferase chain/domain
MHLNGKVREIEELAEVLGSVRGQKKVALCHGVFDLLHVGHIRHLERAKQLGDILAVTVTPDQYVNKGPHRPAFPEQLRLEGVGALGCVDYVALNKWPTAVETIDLLRPDFYVKGCDYEEAGKDATGGIVLEEVAIKSVGGRLVFTEDITFSSSNLINRYLPVLPKATVNYLQNFSTRNRIEDVFRYLERARSLKVLVVGEAIIDEYQYCEQIGKSSKEPMLAVKYLSNEKFVGGILAVGNHVANFCDHVDLVSFLGAEHSQEDFIRKNLHDNIHPIFLHRKASPTIVKRRFIEEYCFTKLLEVYEINDGGLEETDNAALCAKLREQLPRYDVVIVVDFGHGMLSEAAVDLLCRDSRFLAINAQSNAGNLGYHTISRYPRADYVCIAENEMRLEARDRRSDLGEIVRRVCGKLPFGRVVVTRGKQGCLCYGEEEGFFEVPAFAGQVVDRMGAGDAFLSVTALCAAQKAPIEVLGFIGNVVGAQAVATVGNRKPVGRAALLKNIESLLK